MKQQNERAVSPVVGVMLMLIVVIIIAAVVSGFAGGLVGGKNQKTPQTLNGRTDCEYRLLVIELFKGEVTGVDNPIHDQEPEDRNLMELRHSQRHSYNRWGNMTPGVVNFRCYLQYA